jgi:hypothetical protein
MKSAWHLGIVVSAAVSTITLTDNTRQSSGFDSRAQCASLEDLHIPPTAMGLPTGGATITHADFMPDGSTNRLGAHCAIVGEISSVDPGAQNIQFTATLPSHWNGMTIHLGGGGLNGVLPIPHPSTDPGAMRPIFTRGYVVFASDSGHQSRLGPVAALRDASFALNDEQLRNYAGEQLKKTHDAVVFLVKTRYGTVPVRSYFVGASEGGREGLVVIQDYPQDYDGVVTLFPALGLPFSGRGLTLQVISRAMRLNHRAGWISKSKFATLRKAELATCDKLDGLEDSIISNAAACKMDFQRLRCPGGKDTGDGCFSDPQLHTLQLLHSPTRLSYTLANGESILPGFTIGNDWGFRLANTPFAPASLMFAGTDSEVRYFYLRNPNGDPLSFDPLKPGKLLGRVQEISRLFDRPRVDLDKFIARGGKWILIHGMSDEYIPAAGTVEYYHRLVVHYGQAQTDAFLRFYLVPGYGHGHGVSFTIDDPIKLNALENWVERGIAPRTLTIVDSNPEAHGRSRPLCVYPAWPKYNGTGSADLATSFSCVVN